MTDTGPEGELTLRTLAMPRDVNVNGDIFGGWVLSQMDIAGGIVARERAKGRVATVAVDAMKFIRPVKVGDVLCIYVKIGRIGRTSLALEIEAWVLRGRIGAREKVTEAIFTFVAIDDDGRPRVVPAA
ncbi:acyl-CoA thioester hydrolase YciA [Defluviimonas sp. SAOS-178_SWC]|uniref:acyl-CoA thioester hydrolase YciA n=1 Tax=Defluviimonas sp. SAOS-178_SWC TaxID=3121287 RepID=UPI00322140E6